MATSKTTQIGTNGILNYINNKYKCSSKKNTVAIMNLIRFHKPKQKSQLEYLINSHINNTCECGSVSKGSLHSFAENLYDKYLIEFSNITNGINYKTLDDCIIFMRSLFLEQSLKGDHMENKTKDILNKSFDILKSNVIIEVASELQDFKYSVDLVCIKDGIEFAGVQVKPHTYLNFPNTNSVVKVNLEKNMKYEKPVIYIYYDKNEKIIDLNEKIEEILKNRRDIKK